MLHKTVLSDCKQTQNIRIPQVIWKAHMPIYQILFLTNATILKDGRYFTSFEYLSKESSKKEEVSFLEANTTCQLIV